MTMLGLTDLDRWWLACWQTLETHLGRAPTVRELAVYCDRKLSAAHTALTRLFLANQLSRDARGRYVRRRRDAR